jgi:molybdopterin converting factor small subunit
MTNLASEKFMAGEIGVRIRFMGDLRAVIESSDLKLALPRGTSVGTLLKSLAQKYGDPFAKWLFTGSGELHHSIVIFVNGENIQDIGGLSAILGEQGDQVEIIMLPMFEGG